MKRLLLLCLVALCSTATWAYDKSVTIDGTTFYFNIPLDDDDKPTQTLMVTHSGASDKSYSNDSYSGEITVPDSVVLEEWTDSNFITYTGGTYTVVGIDSLAFAGGTAFDGVQYNTSTLTKVTLPSTITTIKGEAFERTAITAITIPSSVTFLGNYVFNACEELASVTFESESTLSAIPTMAFYGNTSLTSIALPESVTSIGQQAFYNCTALASVSLPSNLWRIDKDVFRSCTALTTIEIPAGCTTIEDSAFEGCTALTAFTVAEGSSSFSASDGVLFNYDKTTLVFFPEGSDATTYTIPETVQTIAGYAFYDCVNLQTVSIPEGVTTIDEYAFSSCTSLKEVVIPNSVTTLGQYAFNNCNQATTLTIGTGLTTISTYAFELMSSLTEVVIPDNVQTISDHAFYRCDGLTKIVLGSGVTSLGNYAFQYGNSTTSHGTALTAVYSYHTTAPSLGTSVFRYRDLSYATLYVPEGSSSNYTSSWTGSALGSYNSIAFSSIVELGNVAAGTIFQYEDENGALWYEVTSETTCQVIAAYGDTERYEFDGDDGAKVVIPDTVEYAGVTFTVTRIDDDAFNHALTYTNGRGQTVTGKTELANECPVTIPATVVSIGKSAFAGNSDMGKITFLDGTEPLVLTNTDEDGETGKILHDNTNIPSVYLGRDIVLSGSAAVCSPFYNDAKCTNITVGPTVTTIPDSLFVRTSNGNAKIDFSAATSLTTIGDHAFALQNTQSQNQSTDTLAIPATVTFIGDGAFYGMKSVTTMTLQSANVAVGGPNVFGDASQKRANAVNLHVPADNLNDYENSDWGSVYYVAWADEDVVTVETLRPTAISTTSGGTTYYYATYYNGQYQIKLDDNWFVNVVEDVEEDGSINDATVDEVKYLIAGNAVLIECTEDNYVADTGIVLTGLRANATPFLSGYTNVLYGSDTETQTNVNGSTDGYYFYMLSYDKNGENLGFYWGTENGAPFTSAAHKAWLALDATKAAGFSKLSFKNGGDDTTGITAVSAATSDGAIYTLQGVRVADMSKKGIYIVDGKKVLVK